MRWLEKITSPHLLNWDMVFLTLTIPVAAWYAWPVLGALVGPLLVLRGLWALFT